MKKLIGLLVVLLLVGGVGFVSYRYLVIRDGGNIYLMEKDPGTFDRVYVDVTDWTPKDFMMHPGIAAFIAGRKLQKTGNDLKDAVEDGLDKTKEAVKEGVEKTGEAVKDGVDKLKEKLDE